VDKASWERLARLLIIDSHKSGAQLQWHSLQPLESITDIRQFSEWLLNRNSAFK